MAPMRKGWQWVLLCALAFAAVTAARGDEWAYDRAAVAAQRVRQSLDGLEQVLARNANIAADWREYLRLAEVHQALDLGPDADPAALDLALLRATSDAPTLQHATVRSYAGALAEWQTALLPTDVSVPFAAARQRSQLTAEQPLPDPAAARQTAADRLNELDAHLAAHGAAGQAWRRVLRLDELRSAAATADDDDAPPNVERRFLEAIRLWPTPPLVAAKDALVAWRQTHTPQPAISADATANRQLNALETAWLECQQHPTTDNFALASRQAHALANQGEYAALATALRASASHPNVVLRASSYFVRKQTQSPVARSFPVNEVIQGTPVTGQGQLQGFTWMRPLPSETTAHLDIRLQADMQSHTQATSRGVCIESQSSTVLSGNKRVALDALGLSQQPASVGANSEVQLLGISGPLVRRWVAGMVYDRRQEAARQESEWKTARQSEENFDREANQLRRRLAEKQSRERATWLFAGTEDVARRWRTTPERIEGRFWWAKRNEFAAGTPAPVALPERGLCLQMHETAIERSMGERFAGRTLNSQQMAKELESLWGDLLPVQLDEIVDEDEEGWTIRFTEQALRVRIVQDEIRCSLSAAEFSSERGDYPGVKVTFRYQIVSEPPGLKLQRIGRPEAFPANYDEASGAPISFRQQTLLSVVAHAFQDALPEELELPPMKSSPNGLKVPLEYRHVAAADGWLTVNWEPPVGP
jgi:hypothetical protein